MNTNPHFKSWRGRATDGPARSGTEIKADARLGQAWDGQRVVIICFSAPLHLKDEADAAPPPPPPPPSPPSPPPPPWREKQSGPARVANVTGNKNRPSGSRKLQSLQAASTDSETDNMYGRHGGIAGWKRSFVDYSWTIVLASATADDNRYFL